LLEKPTNVIALLGKVRLVIVVFTCFVPNHQQARILYTQRRFPQALKLFQQVLRLKPDCKPDPRVGIGLCLWAMDDKVKAKAAWQRSLEVVRAHA
jgi:RNA polymerase-associated protein CTR9